MNASEHNNEIFETNGMSKTDKEELLTIDRRKSGQRIVIFRFKILHEEDRIFNQTVYSSNFLGEKVREIVTAEGTSIDAAIDIETDQQKIPEKLVIKDNRRKSLAKTDEAIIEFNDIAEEKDEKKYSVRKEQAEDLEARKDVKTSKVSEKAQLNDPLASLQLYGVTYRGKKTGKKFVEKKLTKQPEAAEEACTGNTKMAKSTEFKEDIEMLQKDTQIIAREIRRPTEIREKSIQINLQKSKKYKKSARTGAKMFKACLKGKEEKRDEERREKWIDKRKDYKERYRINMIKNIKNYS